MDYKAVVLDGVKYLEENLRADVTAQDLADRAGFSLYHYYRLFQEQTHMPVMQYVIRRRILHALNSVENGASQADAALTYGFSTYAGFYKACKREFGYTPRELKERLAGRIPAPWKGETLMLTQKQIRPYLISYHLENEPVSAVFDSGGGQEPNLWAIGKEYLLRAEKDFARLQAECAVQQAMADRGLLASTPVKTGDGKEILREDELSVCLFRRAEGEWLRAQEVYSDDTALQLGVALGKLNGALHSVDYAADEADLFRAAMVWALPKSKEILGLQTEWCKKFLDECARLSPALPRQLIHRDPCPGNVMRAKDAWGFHHFNLMEKNVRLFDPCYAATAVLSETYADSAGNDWFRLCRHILRGYDQAAGLTPEEKQAAPYVVLSIQMICVAWFSEQEQFKDVFQVNVDATRFLIDHFHSLRLAGQD